MKIIKKIIGDPKKLIWLGVVCIALILLRVIFPDAFASVSALIVSIVESPALIEVSGVLTSFATDLIGKAISLISGVDFSVIVENPAFTYAIWGVLFAITYLLCNLFEKFCKVFRFVYAIIPYFFLGGVVNSYKDALAAGQSSWSAGFSVYLPIFLLLSVCMSGSFLRFLKEQENGNWLTALFSSFSTGAVYALIACFIMGCGWAGGVYVMMILATVSALFMVTDASGNATA